MLGSDKGSEEKKKDTKEYNSLFPFSSNLRNASSLWCHFVGLRYFSPTSDA